MKCDEFDRKIERTRNDEKGKKFKGVIFLEVRLKKCRSKILEVKRSMVKKNGER